MAPVGGPYTINLGTSRKQLLQSLQARLERIPKDAQWLRIEDEVPTDEQWTVLGSYFTSVSNLEVEAGWNESLNDRLMPEHWPLQRLVMSSSCGEVTRNPHILLGKVHHLVMLLTMGIRFEGPTITELVQRHEKSVEQGEKQDHGLKESGLTFTYVPTLVNEWMMSKYDGKDINVSADASAINPDVRVTTENQIIAGKSGTYNLTKLEILENDAMEAFIRFTVALPRIAFGLRTLNIRSTNYCDLNNQPEYLFPSLLSTLDRLETLVLSFADVFHEDDTLQTMYHHFPKNIRTLRFRGPISLTRHDKWDDWVTKFGDTHFLPKLERLSFVCDIAYDEPSEGSETQEKRNAAEKELRKSKERCEQLLSAVRNRQQDGQLKSVTIEPFVDEWAALVSGLKGVNPLWNSV